MKTEQLIGYALVLIFFLVTVAIGSLMLILRVDQGWVVGIGSVGLALTVLHVLKQVKKKPEQGIADTFK